MFARRLLVASGLFLAAGSAMAHPGHAASDFATGFVHPLMGADHMLAMLAVGLFAATQRGKQRWMLPVAFVLSMLVGALLGGAGLQLPMVESGIAASVLVFGLLIACVARLPVFAAVPMVAVFALFHGHAHYAEMGHASLLTFVTGFVLATALLHAAGYAVARWMPESTLGRAVRRVAGLAIAGTGAVLLGA